MSIEERLDKMMLDKGINKHQLSIQANIPYTTIDGMFKKGCHNIKLSTLIKLADYFNVSIDYIVGRSESSKYSLAELKEIELFEEFLKYKRSNHG